MFNCVIDTSIFITTKPYQGIKSLLVRRCAKVYVTDKLIREYSERAYKTGLSALIIQRRLNELRQLNKLIYLNYVRCVYVSDEDDDHILNILYTLRDELKIPDIVLLTGNRGLYHRCVMGRFTGFFFRWSPKEMKFIPWRL